MHWPPTHEDNAAWSAVGGVITLVMSGAAFVSSLWPVFAALAAIGFYVCLAPLLHLWPWSRVTRASRSAGIKAGHSIKAGGDIEADVAIEAGHGVEAGGSIRLSSKASPLLFAETARQKADRTQLGLVNPLVGHFRIRQFARPLGHDEQGCVFRVVIAPDCRPGTHELVTTTKDAFRDVLSRSSLEVWGRKRFGQQRATESIDWQRSAPNDGRIATFKREWGASGRWGSVLWARATLQLPPGFQFGPRPVFVLDVVEQPCETDNGSPRLSLSLPELHEFLHVLAKTAVDEIARTLVPLVCENDGLWILGPNYEIEFGDRTLDTLVEIPESFERPQDSSRRLGAEINTPESADARDLGSRDAVIREGIQKTLRNNGYDRIEAEIADLPAPPVAPRNPA